MNKSFKMNEIVGKISSQPGTKNGVVAQSVRASACHAEGRGFESRQSRPRILITICTE